MIQNIKILLLPILLITFYNNIQTAELIEQPVVSITEEAALKENSIIINNSTNEKLAFRYSSLAGLREIAIILANSTKIIDRNNVNLKEPFNIELVRGYNNNSTWQILFENTASYFLNNTGQYELEIDQDQAKDNGVISIDITPSKLPYGLTINMNYFGNDVIRKLQTIDRFLNDEQVGITYLKAQRELKSFIDKVNSFYKNQTILNKEKIIENVLEGALVHYDISKGYKELLENNENKEDLNKKAANFVWFCFALAISKDQSFEEGTFLISDPNLQLYKFLAELGQYRKSSHFNSYAKVTRKEYAVSSQMGLDLNNLPAGKGTLLFGKINEDSKKPESDFMFIKPENYGVNWFSFPLHAQEYLFAQLRKRLPTAINPLGTDDEEYYRKERIPADVANAYSNIIKEIEELSIEKNINFGIDFKENLKEAHGLGINFIYSQLPILLNLENLSENIKDELKVLKDLLESANLKYDNLELRFGREVILTQSDFELFQNRNNMVFFIGNLLEELKKIQ